VARRPGCYRWDGKTNLGRTAAPPKYFFNKMKKNPYPGKFIAIEGLDGAGKSTQTGATINHFNATCACQICATFEPTQFLVGGLVRGRLLNEWNCTPERLQLLFAADRADHLEKEIEPLLEKGVNVICDRYFLSSAAYGGIDCDMDWLLQLNSRFLAPDLTIYLNVAAPVCVKRMQENGRSIELFEKQETLEKVAVNYENAFKGLAGEIEVAVLDGNRPIAQVTKDIIDLLNYKIFNFKTIK
jgi:dTMP kinase